MKTPSNICVTITTGRSGSTYLSNVFESAFGAGHGVLHESLHPGKAKPAFHHRRFDGGAIEDPEVAVHLDTLKALAEFGPVVDFGWILGSLAPACRSAFGQRLRVLAITNHPVAVAASFAVRGHYFRNKNPAWAISPLHERVVFPQYGDRWSAMTPFEKGLYRWLEITLFGLDFKERFPEVPCLTFRSDEIFNNAINLRRIAEFVGFSGAEPRHEAGRNEATDNHVERWPIGREWKRVFDMPDVVSLAESMGFDMSEAEIRRIVSKYQLHGLMPRARHAFGYWAAREHFGALLDRYARGKRE